MEGYPEVALPILKSIAHGRPLAVKDNTNGNSPTEQVEPCPVTAAQAKKLPTYAQLVAKMLTVKPGVTEYSLFCPSK